MKVSDRGYTLIKELEGLVLNAYQCSAGVWTIGYGHTKNVKKGDSITEEKANLFLEKDLKYTVKIVNLYVLVPITQSMFDALCSFVFNVGVNAFKTSTMLKLLNRREYEKAALEFERWIFVRGTRSNGLVNRRKKEQYLFMMDGI